MKSIIQNMIKRAIVTLGGADDKQIPVQQISYNGKVADAEIIFPYGVHANLSAGNNTLCIVFAVEGQEDYRAAMGYTPGLRPKPLEEGEVVFYHPLTQSKIHFRNNGDIDIDVAGDEGSLNATIKKDLNIVVNGNAKIIAEGNTDIAAGGDVNITAVGDVNVVGSTINLN